MDSCVSDWLPLLSDWLPVNPLKDVTPVCEISSSITAFCLCVKDALYTMSSLTLWFQLLDLPGIIEGAKDGKGRGKQVIAGKIMIQIKHTHACTHTNTHARARTHAHTHTPVSYTHLTLPTMAVV